VSHRKLLIFAAVRIETRAIAKMLQSPRVGWPAVELHTIGIRAMRMPPISNAAGVIMAGLAGALDPSLRIGDVVLDAERAETWVTHPCHGSAIHRGAIHTADHLIATPAEKAALFASTRALAVDMEQAIVRAAANAAGVPFIGIRAVSDTADQALNPAVLNLVDEFGRPRAAALAIALARKPSLIPDLMTLGAASRLAADRLAEALAQWLDADGLAADERG
jgi:hypothetical protein